jgi:hypothetical protein
VNNRALIATAVIERKRYSLPVSLKLWGHERRWQIDFDWLARNVTLDRNRLGVYLGDYPIYSLLLQHGISWRHGCMRGWRRVSWGIGFVLRCAGKERRWRRRIIPVRIPKFSTIIERTLDIVSSGLRTSSSHGVHPEVAIFFAQNSTKLAAFAVFVEAHR